MKRSLIISLFLLFTISMQSQVLIALLLGDKLNTGKIEFGLDGGVNFANISNLESNDWFRKWNLGFYFDIKLKNQWYLSTGVLVKADFGNDDLSAEDLEFLEATVYDVEGEYNQSISYFVVPALAKYVFDNHMYAEIGPQFGLMHKAYIEFNSDIEGIEINSQEDNKDMINRIDMGMTAGVGYRLLKGLGWTIGVRYYYGLIDVYKERSGTKNNALFLRANIPFGISQDKKDQIKEMKEDLAEKKARKKEARKAARGKKKNSGS
jgi:hypothetical protein